MVGMEACGGAHYWARELSKLGHEVRLMPPAYVKPYVKRGKTDAADAEAICEAVTRPTMRFVAAKTEAQQSAGVELKVRQMLVRQRTRSVNALRGHLAEFGIIAAGHMTAPYSRHSRRIMQLDPQGASTHDGRDQVTRGTCVPGQEQRKGRCGVLAVRSLSMRTRHQL